MSSWHAQEALPTFSANLALKRGNALLSAQRFPSSASGLPQGHDLGIWGPPGKTGETATLSPHYHRKTGQGELGRPKFLSIEPKVADCQ